MDLEVCEEEECDDSEQVKTSFLVKKEERN